MHENTVYKAILYDFATIQHVEEKQNLADPCTKEDKDVAHFQ